MRKWASIEDGVRISRRRVGIGGWNLPEDRDGEGRDVTRQVRRPRTLRRTDEAAVDFTTGCSRRHVWTWLLVPIQGNNQLGFIYCFRFHCWRGQPVSCTTAAVTVQPSHCLGFVTTDFNVGDLLRRILLLNSQLEAFHQPRLNHRIPNRTLKFGACSQKLRYISNGYLIKTKIQNIQQSVVIKKNEMG